MILAAVFRAEIFSPFTQNLFKSYTLEEAMVAKYSSTFSTSPKTQYTEFIVQRLGPMGPFNSMLNARYYAQCQCTSLRHLDGFYHPLLY